MFGLYFGKYLMDNNLISQAQYDNILTLQQQTRVKLGFIAVAEKLLTTKQAEEINDIQKKMDRRFGDIAIEKGYLLNEEVTYLLNMQGNSYMKLIQVLTDNNLFTIEEIESHMDNFKNTYKFSDSDVDALKSGDIDRIIPVFINTDIPLISDCISLAIRNVVRFINNNIVLQKAYTVSEYSFDALASQRMNGDHEIFVGFAGKDKALLNMADPFAQESFAQLDEDAFDSVCEFINCTNGLYASNLSHKDIHIDMTPPLFYTEKKISSEGSIYIVPVIIEGEQVNLIVAADCQIGIN